jgi:hypothetical protein
MKGGVMFDGPNTDLYDLFASDPKRLKQEARSRSWYWLPFAIAYLGRTFKRATVKKHLRFHAYLNVREALLMTVTTGSGVSTGLWLVTPSPWLQFVPLLMIYAGLWLFTRTSPLTGDRQYKILYRVYPAMTFGAGLFIGALLVLLAWWTTLTVALTTVGGGFIACFLWGFFDVLARIRDARLKRELEK